MAENKVCFVISPIGEENSPQRKDADKVLDYIIAPAVEEKGYTAIRADKISKPGIITSDILQMIVEVPLVIADLTGQNPNVFYELAVRHMLRKPIVQIIRKGEKLPFDIAQSRTIFYSTDIEEALVCRERIVSQINAIESDPNKVDNPISTSVELKSLSDSKNPLEQSNAEILNLLQMVFAKITDINENTAEIKNSFVEIYQEVFESVQRQFEREYRIELSDLIEQLADCERKLINIKYSSFNRSDDDRYSDIEELISGDGYNDEVAKELEAFESERNRLESEVHSDIIGQPDDEYWDQIETDRQELADDLDDIPF